MGVLLLLFLLKDRVEGGPKGLRIPLWKISVVVVGWLMNCVDVYMCSLGWRILFASNFFLFLKSASKQSLYALTINPCGCRVLN